MTYRRTGLGWGTMSGPLVTAGATQAAAAQATTQTDASKPRVATSPGVMDILAMQQPTQQSNPFANQNALVADDSMMRLVVGGVVVVGGIVLLSLLTRRRPIAVAPVVVANGRRRRVRRNGSYDDFLRAYPPQPRVRQTKLEKKVRAKVAAGTAEFRRRMGPAESLAEAARRRGRGAW